MVAHANEAILYAELRYRTEMNDRFAGGIPSWYLNQPPRPTQPGDTSRSRHSGYWRRSRPTPGMKKRVLHNRSVVQDCRYASMIRYDKLYFRAPKS